MIAQTCFRVAAAAAVALAVVPSWAAAQDDPRREAIAKLISAVQFGVPTSPALALLPDQAEEVTHITTPSDLAANASSWIEQGRLRTGAALDWRFLGGYAGSLEDYRASPVRQVIWRTVLGAGTAAAEEGSDDVLLSAGLRVPIIDRGDLRLHSAYEDSVRLLVSAVLDACPPLSATEPVEEAERRCAPRAALDTAVIALQERFRTRSWNALRFDVGLAVALRANNGYLGIDSIVGDRGGAWMGLSHGLGRVPVRFTHVFKSSWARTDSAAQERSRYTLGSRVAAYPFGRIGRTLGLSVEAARLSTSFGDEAKDDTWVHLAAVAEVPLPDLGGLLTGQWLGVAYGGDWGREHGVGQRLTIRYAIYRNRLLPISP
jgi:hypothetical protein